jgi:glyoxylase-like metal-dependent hydrolase (beta-lactamase superfamily II)
MGSVTTLDNNWVGHPRSIAAGLIESGGHCAIVDPGPGSTLATLKQQLQQRGLTVGDIEMLLLTHIHLDHAGASGALLRENPRIEVYVHRVGAPHMIDPSKLMASALRLWPTELHTLFGEMIPVPEENLRLLEGGETVHLGNRKIEVVYTPGHASHHVCYFEQEEGIAFVGDTAGIRINNSPYIMPATPPPDIDLEIWDSSLAMIRERNPSRLFLTHFGLAENPVEHLTAFRDRLQRWLAMVERCIEAHPGDTEAMNAFMAEALAEIAQHLPPSDVQHYAFSAGLNLTFLGLARHLRKRAKKTG